MYTEVLDFIGRKGGYNLLKALEDKPKRWKDIENLVLVSPRTLSQRISGAIDLGLIDKVKQLRGGTAYRLTEKGKNILIGLSEKTREGYILEPQPSIKKTESAAERQNQDPVLMYFPRCPVCHGSKSNLKQLHEGRKDYLLCFSCGAKWHLKLKDDNSLTEAKLVAEGADGQGAGLLDESHKPDFWLRKALKGSTPWPSEGSADSNETQTEV